jgi:broad specificity phosphatase PhoE
LYVFGETDAGFQPDSRGIPLRQGFGRLSGGSYIWLVRHGRSQASVGERTVSAETTQLTDVGLRQADNIAAAVTTRPELIVYTPYIRSERTAKALMKKYPQSPNEMWPLHEFTYLSPEKYNNTSRDDRKPQKEKYWSLCDPDYRDGDDAETYVEFVDRVRAGIEGLRKRSGLVVVFTHGHVIRTLVWYMLNGRLDPSKEGLHRYYHFREAFRVPNASILRLNLAERSISGLQTDHLKS